MAVTIRSDEDIKKDVVDQLYWDGRVDAAEVMVEVMNGVVRLTGSVPTYSARRAAEDDARLIEGVASVDNQLEVKHPKESEIPADDEIQENLANVLTWAPDLDQSDIDLAVEGGWVTLWGTVDAYWKKLKAEELASTLSGVRGVTNELAVVPSRTYEDRLVAESLVSALDRNVYVDAEYIDVHVNGGVVTLSGSVSSLPAFRAAEETAEHTPGVVEVRNELVIR